MLFRVVDHKGKERWINPIYVKAVAPKGEGESELEVSGWSFKVRVRQRADELAMAINAAMPDAAEYIAAQESERQAQEASEQAAQSAVTGGLLG